MLEGLAYDSEKLQLLLKSCLYAALGIWLEQRAGVTVLSRSRALPIPLILHQAVITPSDTIRSGRWARAVASCCLQPGMRSQNFQSLNWAHLFWSPTYHREQLGPRNSTHIFPEPNPWYLRKLTTNQRMRWIKFKRRKEYKAILWKRTRILYTLNKSPVHVCAPVRLCIIIYHCLPIPSPFV